MADLLDRIYHQMNTRVNELRPLVDEHSRLCAALAVLGETERKPPAPPPPPAAQPKSRAPKRAPATARKRAPRGANRLAVLQAAENRPGATSAELATVSGVERNTLNALLARLVNSGELQTEALPTGRTGYALGHAQAGASAGSPPAAGDTT